MLYGGALEQISAAGVVFREYLLSDLSSDLIDLSHVRLAVFLNAFEIPSALRSHISNKLEKDGRSLLFIYAAGLLNEVGTLNRTSMRELLGFEVRRGDTALPGPVQCNVKMDNIQVSFGLPDDGSWDPWFFVYDHSAEILGTYSNGKASLACCDKGTHKTYYSALPGLPKDIYRAIARRSGVHFFSSVPTDQVDLAGNTVLLITRLGGNRELSLPFEVANVVDVISDAHRPLSIRGSSFRTGMLEANEVYVYQSS